jgi:hypothetical protein
MISNPITHLTKNGVPFVWTEECQQAYDKLKDKLLSAPVLATFDQKIVIEIHTDTSKQGLGAILNQRDDNNQFREVAFASRLLNKHESNYSITELEALAVLFALNKFREYIFISVKIVVDHHSLCALLAPKSPKSARLARWLVQLMDYKIEKVYKTGITHLAPDCLSRLIPFEEKTSRHDQDNDSQPAEIMSISDTNEMLLNKPSTVSH